MKCSNIMKISALRKESGQSQSLMERGKLLKAVYFRYIMNDNYLTSLHRAEKFLILLLDMHI